MSRHLELARKAQASEELFELPARRPAVAGRGEHIVSTPERPAIVPPLAPTPMTNLRWLMCALLFFATTVNYIDRQILALIKELLDHELGWTNEQFGLVNSAFQGAYAVGLLAFGWFVDRYGTKIGYAVSIFAWSLAAMSHALVGSVGGFFTARVALGVSEGGNFPSAIKAVALWFPKRERAFATAIFNSGANVGAIIAPRHHPGHRADARLAMGIHLRRYRRPDLAAVLVPALRDSGAAEERFRGGAGADPERYGRRSIRRRADGMASRAAPPADVVVHRGEIPDRSDLVVLPDLAAGLLPEPRAA